jgi:hypothetical protein
MKKVFNNRKGKILIFGMALMIIIAIILLIIVSNNLDGPATKNFGKLQEKIINAVNKKDSLLLYLDTSAELAKRDVSQHALGENAGFSVDIYSSMKTTVTPCGDYIYPMLSDTNGQLCVDDVGSEKQYLAEFNKKIMFYLRKNSFFRNSKFSNLNILQDYIIGISNGKLAEIPISEEILDIQLIPQFSVLNLNLAPSKYADTFTKEILKNANVNGVYFNDLTVGQCSSFVQRLIKFGYKKPKNYDIGINSELSCFPGHAWRVAACYLDKSLSDPDKSRIVWEGNGLSFNDIQNNINLELGDLLFISNDDSWCIYSGMNEYVGTNVCSSTMKTYHTPFCVKDSFSSMIDNPSYCQFNDETKLGKIVYTGFPIVTHIFIVLEKQNNDYVIGNLYSQRSITGKLSNFLATPNDGIRIIVRPDYPKKLV